jgi:hypothetical protein
MSGTCGAYGEVRNAYKVSVRKPQRKRHLEDLGVEGRTMDLREKGCESVDRIQLTLDFVIVVMHTRVS